MLETIKFGNPIIDIEYTLEIFKLFIEKVNSVCASPKLTVFKVNNFSNVEIDYITLISFTDKKKSEFVVAALLDGESSDLFLSGVMYRVTFIKTDLEQFNEELTFSDSEKEKFITFRYQLLEGKVHNSPSSIG